MYIDPYAFEHARLSNNLDVYTNLSFSICAVQIGVVLEAGSREDPPGKKGLAHFMEHMPFRGTKNYPDTVALASPIENYGGDLNASTNKERIVFEAKVALDDIDLALRTLDELLHSAINRASDFEIERGSIMEEWKNKWVNPGVYAMNILNQQLLAGHPLAHPIIGELEDLQTLTIADIEHFYDCYARHGVVKIFAVGGGMETERLLEKIDRVFGKRPTATSVRTVGAILPVAKQHLEISDKPYNRSHMVMGATTFPACQFRDCVVAATSCAMLQGGLSSPLFTALREREGLVYNFGFSHSAFSDVGVVVFHAPTSYANIGRVRKIFFETVERVSTDAMRLETVKQMVVKSADIEERSLGGILRDAANAVITGGYEPKTLEEQKNAVESVTIEEVGKFLGTFVRPERFMSVVVRSQTE